MAQTQQLIATPEDVSNNVLTGRVVTYATSDPTIATVDGAGLVAAVSIGTCTITATCETKTATCAVTVSNASTVASIAISPTSSTIAVAGTLSITATPEDASGNALTDTVSWTTSDASIATVDSTGLVTAVAAGSCTITATDGSVTATCAITVVSGVTRQFWWAANTLSLTDGQLVGTWLDQVGGVALSQTNNAVKPTYHTNEIGGQPGVDFEAGQRMTFTMVDGSQFTRFIVANVGGGATPTADAYLFATPMAWLWVKTNGAVRFQINKSGGTIVEWDTAASTVVYGTPHVYMISYDASSLANNPLLHIDGVAVTMTLSGGTQTGTRLSDAGTGQIGSDTGLAHECMGPWSEAVFIATAGGNTTEENRLLTLYGL